VEKHWSHFREYVKNLIEAGSWTTGEDVNNDGNQVEHKP